MNTLPFDLRDAFRRLRRDPGYAATIVLTLGLTIGATTAMFSIVDGVLLKPLSYRDPRQLVAIKEIWRTTPDRFSVLEVNERHFEYWRQNARSFESMAQYRALPGNLTGAGDAAQINVARASGSLFDVLHVPAAIGRTLTPEDDPLDRPDVVVVTDLLWRQRLDSDPVAVGRVVAINGTPRTIVGVLPRDFRLPERGSASDAVHAFIPLRVDVGWVGDHNNAAIGRLRRGVTIEQARAEIDALQVQVGALATKEAGEPVTLANAIAPLAESMVGGARRGLLLLFAAIAAVLVIACSNLTNLSLVRTVGRLRDAAIRSALGAGRARLIGGAVLEQLILTVAGGALGLWIASLALRLFVRTAPLDLPRVGDVVLDGRAMSFATAISVLAGAVVAIVPAWRLAGRDLQDTLRSGGAAVVGDRRGMRTRAWLLSIQVALALVLLAVTGLLSVSLLRAAGVDLGYSAERVAAVGISLPSARYVREADRVAIYDRLRAAVHALPGVRTVTMASMLPLTGTGQSNFIVAEGANVLRSAQPSANFRFVAPDFFETLQMSIRRGRAFTDAERDPRRPAPAVISEPVAERLWRGQDPIGKRFSRGLGDEQGFEVVGVAVNARVTSIERTPPLMVYVPYWWRSRATTSLLVKSETDPVSLLPAIQRAVREIDPEIALGQARPLADLAEAALAARRYQAQLFIVFGAAALAIATIGVYGVASYNVLRRRREMVIRAALGARRSQVLGLVLRQTTAPIAAGVVAGLAGAVAAGQVVASLLFEVQPRDPAILIGVTVAVGGVGLLAVVAAVRLGLSLDATAALRDE